MSTGRQVTVSEFGLALFVRRKPQMTAMAARRLDLIKNAGEWNMFGAFVVLDALKAEDLTRREVEDATALAQAGEFAESSEHVLVKLAELRRDW